MESSTKPQEADLLALPNEMFWRILEFCEFRDVCRLLEVSKSIQARCTTWPVLSISLTNYRQTISRSHIKAIVQRWGRNLRSLTVTQCDATDETLRHVALHAPRLNELYAGKTDISDEGIKAVVAACPGLQVISVPFTRITNEAVFAISRSCPRLELMSLRECGAITTPSISALATKCHRLRTIFLEGTNISDGALIALAGFCPNLHAVSISGIASIKDRGVINLAKSCPKLVMLDCFGTGITNAALDAIATHCAEMQYLNLGLCLRLTTAGLLDSLPRMPRLYDLDVSGITVTDGVVSALVRNARHIRRLNVSRTRVSGGFAQLLGALNLSLLRARGVTYMEQPVLGDYIAQAGENLETLDLSLCAVTDAIVHGIAARCAQLLRLYIDGCPVSDGAFLALVSQRRDTLEYISIIGTNVTEEAVAEARALSPRLSIIGPKGSVEDLPWI